eukprot:scaffold39171_cov195-Skeletonema_marinoi.AAC.2
METTSSPLRSFWVYTPSQLRLDHGILSNGLNTKPFLKYLFTFTCVWCIVAALFGYRTLKNYGKDPVAAEKALAIEYGLITFGAYGAGFAEFTGIASKFMYKMEHGVSMTYPELDPLFGHSFYDILPEKYGMTIFFAWVAIVWFWWHIKLLQPDLIVGEGKTKEREPLNATSDLFLVVTTSSIVQSICWELVTQVDKGTLFSASFSV